MIPARGTILQGVPEPTFARNFAATRTLNNGIGPAITFSRGSVGTYFDQTGTLQTASSGVPRFDHDPVTRTSRGLLIEEARTNLVLNSATGNSQTITVTSGSSYTISFYGTGSVTMTGAYAGTLNGTGTFPTRTSLTFTAATAALVISTITGTVQNIQLELGSFPTSYIPTTTAAVTRNADLAQVTGNAFQSFYNQTAGTFVAGIRRALPVGAGPPAPRIVDVVSLNGDHQIFLGRGSQVTIVVINSSGGDFYRQLIGPFYPENNSLLNFCLAYQSSNGVGASNQILGTPTNNGNILNTSMTSMVLGDNGTGNRCLQGCISSVAYYPRRLNDQQLIALTR